ncbi:peroxiredoxin [Sphingobium jiangsuense]|uniref:thioredoxin-dependent peroxiredoxin n=1 Tax=Sphingobium jiangsuense TaxID=870476 RepID=A0A7W6FR43_9SPHN|nr:thioredoxin-dependent thiol peroxidase [Sphingobium jiangsuense]MBB3926639.1 peroxiredoxin Q/BCP [Sphingobium jiangsuense]GLT01652.1 peroxiredoxin [Sphingobium jiangsuense]
MLDTGDAMPEATLVDADGVSFPLSRYRGRPLVVYFYPKADTPGCTNEAKDFTELANQFDAAGVAVVGVSRDKPARLAKFRDKYGLKLLLASDEDGAVCEAFGTWVEKSLYGRTYMGIARATFLFDGEGKAVRVWPKVKVKGHAAEVLEAAKALG